MTHFLKVFDLIPGWAYAATIATLVIGGGLAMSAQSTRLAAANTKIAELQLVAETDRADRAQLVADHNSKIASMQAAHATTQQEIISGFIDQKLRLEGERNAAVARADRVQHDAQARAAADRAAAGRDPVACERVADRNEALYGLVSEGFRLVQEGGVLLGAAAVDINTLKQIIANDRAAICGTTN